MTDEEMSSEPEEPTNGDVETLDSSGPGESSQTVATPAVSPDEATACRAARGPRHPSRRRSATVVVVDRRDSGVRGSSPGPFVGCACAHVARHRSRPHRGRAAGSSCSSPARVVGGLVGALVAGGIVAVATNDDSSNSTTRVVERVVPAKNAPNTSVFVEPADIQGVLAKVEPAVVADHHRWRDRSARRRQLERRRGHRVRGVGRRRDRHQQPRGRRREEPDPGQLLRRHEEEGDRARERLVDRPRGHQGRRREPADREARATPTRCRWAIR